ncbi:MAG: uncharacterized protein A8A55_2451 [Amphiamblys sp. WSBS2006]|nr:MAG: uncharacterized protein A8A55_2451 [Amphiamblys sp. WSBS2006]
MKMENRSIQIGKVDCFELRGRFAPGIIPKLKINTEHTVKLLFIDVLEDDVFEGFLHTDFKTNGIKKIQMGMIKEISIDGKDTEKILSYLTVPDGNVVSKINVHHLHQKSFGEKKKVYEYIRGPDVSLGEIRKITADENKKRKETVSISLLKEAKGTHSGYGKGIPIVLTVIGISAICGISAWVYHERKNRVF